MLWFFAAIAAYFCFALSSTVDRFLLAGPLPHARLYAFSAGATGAFALLLVPFGFSVPQPPLMGAMLFAGALNVAALTALFHAVRQSHVSRIIPMVGAFSPFFIAIGATAIAPGALATTLAASGAIVPLILGTTLLAVRTERGSLRLSFADVRNAAFASLLLAAGIVLMKYIFINAAFINAIIWTNFGSLIAAGSILLLSQETRALALQRGTWFQRRVAVPILFGKAAGGAGSLLLLASIYFAKASQLTLIGALQGIQYLFLLSFVWLLSLKNPALLREEISARAVPLRLAGASAIAFGLYRIFSL